MAQIIITITRDDPTKEWLRVNTPELQAIYFTQTEIDEIIEPYKVLLASMPGFVQIRTKFPDENTMTLNYTFDTLEHAQTARSELSTTDPETLPGKHKKLFTDLRNKLGLNYTFEYAVIE